MCLIDIFQLPEGKLDIILEFESLTYHHFPTLERQYHICKLEINMIEWAYNKMLSPLSMQ